MKCKVTCPYCGVEITFIDIKAGDSLVDCVDSCGKTFVVVAPMEPPIAEAKGYKIDGYEQD